MRNRWMLLAWGIAAWLALGWGAAPVGAGQWEQRLGPPPQEMGEAYAAAVDYMVHLPLVFGEGEAEPPPPPPDGRQEALDLFNDEYLGSSYEETGWTGSHDSCDPGDTSQAFKAAVVKRINYYRTAAGLPPITGLNPEASRKAQAAALMMSRNSSLSHTPPESWTCYSADGSSAAGRSNLYLGGNGPHAIAGYIHDFGPGNEAVGHRRWILFPPMVQMGSGDVPSVGNFWASNALTVIGDELWGARPDPRDGFVAWPPQGYAPHLVVFRRWSFSVNGADFSNAAVTMTSGGQPVPVKVNTPQYGFGDSTLVWEVTSVGQYDTWPRPTADTTYTITVRGVLVGGSPTDYTYDVIVFDPFK